MQRWRIEIEACADEMEFPDDTAQDVIDDDSRTDYRRAPGCAGDDLEPLEIAVNSVLWVSHRVKLSTLCLLLFCGVAAGFSFGAAFDAALAHQSARMLFNLFLGVVDLAMAVMNIAFARAGL